MIFVGIDISVNSTAITILKDGFYYFLNYTTKKPNYKWIKQTNNIVNYSYLKFGYKDIDDFSDRLIQKIKDYDDYSDLIVSELKQIGDEFIISIEGYNYGLVTTDSIIDISELSSIIKIKLINNFPTSKITLIPPKSVKINACKMVYKVKDGEKVVRNEKGVAGGSFDKRDMLLAYYKTLDNNNLKDFLNENKDTILNMKSIPKPFDDIIDSIWLCKISESL